MRVKGDVLMIAPAMDNEIYAVPKTSQWLVTCDSAGLWLIFPGTDTDQAMIQVSTADNRIVTKNMRSE